MATTKKKTQRSSVPVNYWGRKGAARTFGREQFQVFWLGPQGLQRINHLAESVTWVDETAIMTGTVQIREQPYGRPPDLATGGQIILQCSLKGDGRYIELWRMWIIQPERDFVSSTRTFQLTNALGILQRSRDDFKYVKNKTHKAGWRASDVAISVARRYKVPVGKVVRTQHRIKKLVRLNSSPLEAIAAAYKRERNYTHRRYVISCDHGRLNILPLRRSQALIELGPTLVGASLQETWRNDMATALTVRATPKTATKKADKKKKSRHKLKKIHVKVSSPKAIKQYGYIHKFFVAKDADTLAEAKKAGLRRITLVGKPIRELQLSHPGIPTLRRGDALHATLPDKALAQVIYVTRVEHSLGPGNYTVSIGVRFTDPYVDAKIKRVTSNKKKAAQKRSRKGKAAAATHPQTKKSSKHRTKPTPGEMLTARGHPRLP
jgi:hypothetical protein